jgi:hypothetical protein
LVLSQQLAAFLNEQLFFFGCIRTGVQSRQEVTVLLSEARRDGPKWHIRL